MKTFNFQYKQTGAVLIVALVLLVVLTMLGISAIEATKLETRMAANTREYNQAFQNAEAGLNYVNNLLNAAGGGIIPESNVLVPAEEIFKDVLENEQVDLLDPDVAEVMVMLPSSQFDTDDRTNTATRIIVAQSIGKSARGQRVELSSGFKISAPKRPVDGQDVDAGELLGTDTSGGSSEDSGGDGS